MFDKQKQRMKEKIIKDAKLDTVKKTEDFIENLLSKMNMKQLKKTKEHVLKTIKKQGSNDANMIVLTLVNEKIDKYDK